MDATISEEEGVCFGVFVCFGVRNRGRNVLGGSSGSSYIMRRCVCVCVCACVCVCQ